MGPRRTAKEVLGTREVLGTAREVTRNYAGSTRKYEVTRISTRTLKKY